MFIDAFRAEFGVEPICRVLQFAPSTYWSQKRRPLSLRSIRDEELKTEIERVYEENFRVYGAPKIWVQLNREGIRVARCTVERLMGDLEIQGAVRGNRNGPRSPPTILLPGRLTWSTDISPLQLRTGCGWLTSPM